MYLDAHELNHDLMMMTIMGDEDDDEGDEITMKAILMRRATVC